MKVGHALSLKKDSHKAGLEIAKKVLEQTSQTDVAFLFTTEKYDHKTLLQAIHSVMGPLPLAGLSTGGIIFGNKLYESGVALLTVECEELLVDTAFAKNISAQGYEKGVKIGQKYLKNKVKNGTVFLFPDGFGTATTEFIEGIYDTMGPDYCYFGGGAGDSQNFLKSYQFTGKHLGTDAVSSIFLSGITLKSFLGHGLMPSSEPVVITSSHEKRVYEIAGDPAFQAYKKRYPDLTRGNFTEFIGNYPLGFPDIWGNYCIREPITLHPDDSIEFVGEVMDQSVGSFMQGDINSLLSSTKKIVRSAKETLDQPSFMIVCDSVSRYKLMHKEYQRELDIISETIASHIPLVGFLSSGEIGALNTVPAFHNKTLGIIIGGESL